MLMPSNVFSSKRKPDEGLERQSPKYILSAYYKKELLRKMAAIFTSAYLKTKHKYKTF